MYNTGERYRHNRIDRRINERRNNIGVSRKLLGKNNTEKRLQRSLVKQKLRKEVGRLFNKAKESKTG